MVLLVGCGGDDSAAKPDVFVNPGPDYDLSCLGNMRSTVPTLLTLDINLLDLTGTAPTPIPDGTLTAYAFSDGTQLATSMMPTDMMGKSSIEIPTTGTPARLYFDIEAAGFVQARTTVNIPPWQSGPGIWPMVKQSRIDALAQSLGATLDSTKGVLEVWAGDCSVRNELPGAAVTLDGAATSWAMYGGVGVWIPRDTLLGTLDHVNNGSAAGIVNVAPGMHQVNVSAEGLSLTSSVNVKAGAWNVLIIVPGQPLN
jgi:hypothetical protein